MAIAKTKPASIGAVPDVGQPVPGREPLRIGSVALAVRDLDRVEAFYRDVLGLDVLDRSDGRARLGVGNYGFLDLLHRPDALPDDRATAGLFHTAFLLPTRADLGRWLAHAAQRRQPLDGAADHLVSEALYLSDPEGNGVEVYADRPRAQWHWTEGAEGRRVEMANLPLDSQGLLREARTPWSGAPGGTRVGHVHLRVGDASKAGQFYGDVLGLDTVAALPSATFLSTGGYHHHIAANTWQSRGAGLRDPRRAGLAGVTFEAADRGVLDGIAQRAGAALSEDGLRDPWGTALHLRVAGETSP